MTTWEEALTSWGAVYAALFLPAILMLGNFVFGKCFVSEAMCMSQHAPQSVHTRSRILGRAHVALVTLSFAWQYYIVMFVARTKTGGNADARACNPLFFVWDLVDHLPYLRGVQLSLLVQCHSSDVAYLVLVGLFALFYASCVFSVPQVISRSASAEGHDGISYCRRCGSHIKQMDHHCYFIGNCVGDRNRRLFLCCLVTGVANLSYLLYKYALWTLAHGDAITNFGAILVFVFDVFLTALLGFQMFVLRRGWTTREFLRRRRHAKEPVVRFILWLCFF
ncbi:zinc-finger multi-pass transmembrane protein [Leishmania donovani]|uniref:Palmitoyltransferase n=1 Tax=Leishmania donovani TaxID=5661 RepID=A0A3Q8IC46_LEIDO|nr:zinc-finger multi-pass transmembrane protein [Leishmania donovani]AYU79321.1 zinc-finger multi-pass transmembrane protein [Leishmania donovani]TPP52355.1 DHHC palmitoyltransferase family protein [Leishmania donovani]CBZ34623.1 zinc-finger multi-pass transmembrane protein [Leishmania donovani]